MKQDPDAAANKGQKLVADQIYWIRASSLPNKTIADWLGVHYKTVKRVRDGRRWKHLLPGSVNNGKRGTALERFMAKVVPEPNSGCWLWTGHAKAKGGYGIFNFGGRKQTILAHRWSARELGRLDIEGLLVCHKCDVPSCVNPSHLYAGTIADNMADWSKRGDFTRRKGEHNGRSKLTEKDVREIRHKLSAGHAPGLLSKEYGVVYQTIYDIGKGRTWRHVELGAARWTVDNEEVMQ